MRIFVSHPYADNPEPNRAKAEKICRDLVKEGHLPFEPAPFILIYGWRRLS